MQAVNPSYAKQITNYTKQRYIVYALIALVVLALPFIRIDGNHFFLLSFEHKKLDLFFVRFDTQELYLMPFLLIGLFLTVFFVTTLAGRIWCAWSCPQTIFRVIYRDLIQTKMLKIHKSIKNKQKQDNKHKIQKFIALCLFQLISLIAVSNLLWYFVPPEDFFVYLQDPSEHSLLMGILIISSLLFTLDICFLQENFCIYVCPYARIQSVMFDTNTLQVIYDEKRGGKIFEGATKLHKKPPQGECIGCEACVSICPTHIDIRKGMQLECINCLECADACSVVQGKFNRPSLIGWTSFEATQKRVKTKYLRFRTVAYGIVLCIMLVVLGVVGSQKEYMLLNINRSSQLYDIKLVNGEAVVNNAYVFLFHNSDNKAHTYYFEARLKDKEGGIKILRPSEPFELKAGGNVKKIVVLQASENLAKSEIEDTILPMQIRAFAVDDEKIEVFRDSIFVHPKRDFK
ncbi:cytochrome c oxidase accessory protein CcoG [Campylobacter troglodytis]|uniref:cytochrome c oxidase accessory protein CcoG n=1 Tax=Campylobacter troglodytis TaxID=654363 RepID=UPI00115C2006|nr:cytochrome c oxidase accessory protein CcoG [Campylobacter troglodytis]TQR61507.1 cytochrome c oxidase accessory protein CcoG [Campylobacter troglodytis]